jgi:hypothetical protein
MTTSRPRDRSSTRSRRGKRQWKGTGTRASPAGVPSTPHLDGAAARCRRDGEAQELGAEWTHLGACAPRARHRHHLRAARGGRGGGVHQVARERGAAARGDGAEGEVGAAIRVERLLVSAVGTRLSSTTSSPTRARRFAPRCNLSSCSRTHRPARVRSCAATCPSVQRDLMHPCVISRCPDRGA